MSSLLNVIFITTLALVFVNSALIEKREVCAGCASDADSNDPNLKTLLIAILAERNDQSEVIRVVKATKQVVAGIKYVVEFEARAEGQSKICDTTFVHQPWLQKKINIIDFDCRQ
ncbi:hypothetical protein O3M35_006059 [Rhynocoris fuscipes]|uniref:Cystatin domain-containing protein n=1 Tax=Rhynocoris fuscipes TaxID=488301 RepID=A0AAW1DBY5_9HEMI